MQSIFRVNFLSGWWKEIDKPIVIALCIIFGMSMMLVATSGPAVANRVGLAESYFITRHLIYLVIAAIIILIISGANKKWVRRISFIGFIISSMLLILVQFYGYEVKGAKRWINILGFSMQPSEFVKPFFAVVTGFILSLKKDYDFPGFVVSFILYSFVAMVLAMQPDFGMLVMISAVWCTQLFVAGMPFLWILLAAIFGAIGVTVAYIMLPHVAIRINNFLDPGISENYQVTKSLMAFESGGFFGRGPGEGIIKQSLPDSHTDFIFAVAGEEFGILVCIAIAAVFIFIVLRGLYKISTESDTYTALAASGILVQFGMQAIINMCVTLNLLPTKGMTLPFISYGGSSTFALAIGIGMLLAFTKKRFILTRYKIKF